MTYANIPKTFTSQYIDGGVSTMSCQRSGGFLESIEGKRQSENGGGIGTVGDWKRGRDIRMEKILQSIYVSMSYFGKSRPKKVNCVT